MTYLSYLNKFQDPRVTGRTDTHKMEHIIYITIANVHWLMSNMG